MGVLSPPGPFLQKKAKKRPKKFFEEREGNSISCPGTFFFFWPFLAFVAEKGQKGLKRLFLVQKSGGTIFLGGVKKHELGVRNYR